MIGGIVSVLVPLMGSDFSWLPTKRFKAADGVMSSGPLGSTCALIIAAGVWVVSVRNGRSEWVAKTKGVIISVLVAMIILTSADAVTGLLIGRFAHITP